MSNSAAFVLLVLGSWAIAAWLVVAGHPWFALLMIAAGGSVSFTSTKSK